MDENSIYLKEPIPKLQTKKCKFLASVLSVFLSYTHFFVALITLYMYDFFIAILALILAYIVMGIVRSKIRNSAIPPKQWEYHYSDKEIATWFVSNEWCFYKE